MENKYFQEALASMVSKAAYVDAVRHMYDNGYSVEDIHNKIGYPVSIEKIEKVINDYEIEKASPDSKYEFVQRTDELGRRSFIKVEKDRS